MTDRASQKLEYGVCDCEYPCSCVRFEGELYSSWKEVIDALAKQRDRAEELIARIDDDLAIDLYEVYG